ncbi:MAG: hypothetical protein JXB17_01215 [Bacteroidales bacterium]|nr:hypothetical protein [Bacteroidales bacterium]
MMKSINKNNLHNRIIELEKENLVLKLSEERFSKAFHINSNLMAIFEFESRKFIDVNQKFLDTFQLTKEEVIGKTEKDINIFDADTRKK